MGKGIFTVSIRVIVLVYCLAAVVYLASHPNIFQWDFKAYYHAARAYAAGLNPYDVVVTAAVGEYSDSPGSFRFIYPLPMLFLFLPLSPLRYTAALHIFLLVKLVLLAGLIYLWGKEFIEDKPDLSFYLFCIVAFNSPLYIDFRAGNVAIVEQFALWLAFYFFLKRRLLLFCLFILIPAAIKVTPILFLFLLWFLEDRERHLYFFGSLLIFVVSLALFQFCTPVLFASFLYQAGRTIAKSSQPSTFALLGDLLGRLRMSLCPSAAERIQLAAYGAIAVAVLVVTWRACVALRSLRLVSGEKILIFLACAVYAVILPHFEDYSYIIVLVPAYVIVRRSGRGDRAALLLFMILSAAGTTLPLVRPLMRIILAYSPLMLTYLVWGLYVREISSRSIASKGQ
ncbi:MAG: glycosyltransferase 87 family protein [Candidatus Aureabacteria bacterium]|nr:glycosyltransferase 87 family protein [Candidatus Auribacterota bacterium]